MHGLPKIIIFSQNVCFHTSQKRPQITVNTKKERVSQRQPICFPISCSPSLRLFVLQRPQEVGIRPLLILVSFGRHGRRSEVVGSQSPEEVRVSQRSQEVSAPQATEKVGVPLVSDLRQRGGVSEMIVAAQGIVELVGAASEGAQEVGVASGSAKKKDRF